MKPMIPYLTWAILGGCAAPPVEEVSSPSATPPAVPARIGSSAPPPAAVLPVSPDSRVILGDRMAAEEIAEDIGSEAGYPVLVHWADLERAGHHRDKQVRSGAPASDLESFYQLLASNAARQSAPAAEAMIESRVIDGIMEMATQGYFDRLERRMICYNIEGGALEMQRGDFERAAAAEQLEEGDPDEIGMVYGRTMEECIREVMDLIQQSVETEGWADQGGDLGVILQVSGRLFISAPDRFHVQIGDLLFSLPGDPPAYMVGGPLLENLPVAAEGSPRLTTRVVLGDWMTVADAFEAIGHAAGCRLFVHWGNLEWIGLDRDQRLGMSTPAIGIETAIRVIQDTVPHQRYFFPRLMYRITDGSMEIATANLFESQRRETVCYDIAGFAFEKWGSTAWNESITRRVPQYHYEARVRDIADLIQQLVETEGWVDNGGDAASIRIIGSRLLIEAPRRYHDQIRALLGRLPGNPPFRVVPVPTDLPSQAAEPISD